MYEVCPIQIFYFSGTGNSKMMALELAALLPGAETVDMARYDLRQPVTAQTVGFVFPVYFWGLPNLVHSFLATVTLPAGAYTFAIATMGAAAGAALPLVDQYLCRKGAPLRAGWTVKLPDGFLFLLGPGTPQDQEKRLSAARHRLPAMAAMIQAKTPTKLPRLNPAMALYHQSQRKRFGEKDRRFSVTDACIGCGQCQRICPVENISLVVGRPVWQHHCELCMACIQSCPNRAISGGAIADKRTRYLNPYV